MSEQPPENVLVSKKRSHDEAEGYPAPEASIVKSEETPLPIPTSPPPKPSSSEPKRQLSPPISTQSSGLSDAKSMTPSALQATPPPAAGHGQAKKLKRSCAETAHEKAVEKALKQSEKEAREKKKAEEVEHKEQERLARDEEKRLKEEEKEVARRKRDLDKAEKQKVKEAEKQAREDVKRKKEAEKKVKDAEKQAKEDAKRKMEDEKKRKAQMQLRLGSFFQKPLAGEVSQECSRPSSRRSSVISVVGIEELEKEVTAKVRAQMKPEARYGFLPFFVAKTVQLAPSNRFAQDENLTNMAVSRLDTRLKQEYNLRIEDLTSTFKSTKRKRCQMPQPTMKEIIDSIQGTATSPINLTDSATAPQLYHIPYKILSFKEDVRPPYKGTYTRAVPPTAALKLSRRPFTRHLPNTNYDYDSEAEWEPPNEDDEDIDSGGDDDSDLGEEAAEEDMDGFLDDEDDPGRRKHITGGEMIPITSGLCWADNNTKDDDGRGPLEEYKIQTLSDDTLLPIDPYSTAYWPKAQQHTPKQQQQPPMQPPRLPLSNLNPNRSPSMTPPSLKGEADQGSDMLCPNAAPAKTQQQKQQQQEQTLSSTSTTKPLKLAPEAVLPAFKQAVVGNGLTKAGLVEVLKKQ